MYESTRIIQGGSYLDKALEVAKSRVLGWDTKFGSTQHIGLEPSQ